MWALFALLVVNKFFYEDLPNYTIGRVCVWEYIAMLLALLIAKLIEKSWGGILIEQKNNKSYIKLNIKYGVYFFVYFIILIAIAIWQFWLFSKEF